MATNNTDQVGIKLEDEYRENLKSIKQHIMNWTDAKLLSFVGVWLEKMESLDIESNEVKRVRNNYLTELCRQIQTGKIDLPFCKEPPTGQLEELSSNLASLANSTVYDSDSWSDISEAKTCEEKSEADPDTGSPKRQIHRPNSKQRNVSFKIPLEKCLQEMEVSLDDEKFFLSLMHQKDVEMAKRISDVRISILENYEKRLSKINEEKVIELDKKVNEIKKSLQQEYDLNIQKIINEKNIEWELKMNEKELELKAENEQKLKKMEEEKDKEWSDKIETIKKDMTEEFAKKIADLSAEHKKMLRDKDDEIDRIEKQMDEQGRRFSEERLNQSASQTSTNEKELMKKITFLQNYSTKLERLFKKYEQKYTEKVENLRRDLVMKENSIQIQMMTQNAQMLTQCRSENQQEIEHVVDQLESKYRKLLEEQMQQIQKCKYVNVNSKIDVT